MDSKSLSDEPCKWSLPDVWCLFGFERWTRPKGAVAGESWEQWIGGFEVGEAEIDAYLAAVLPAVSSTTDLRNRLNESDDDQQRLHILMDDPTLHARGALQFWDVVPRVADDRLAVEFMTPHQSHYYQAKPAQGSRTPHDSGTPNPVSFLTVPPGSEFAFHVRCDLARLKCTAPRLAERDRWKSLVKAAFEHAFEWLGFGAKTAVGYGAMEPDRQAEDAARKRADLEAARRAEEEKERRRLEAEKAEAARRAAEEVARRAEFDALPESRKRLVEVERLLDAIRASGHIDEHHRNQLKSGANRLVEQTVLWSDAGERQEAAALLERLYEFIGRHDPGRTRRQREKQIRKRRDAIARVRHGGNDAPGSGVCRFFGFWRRNRV